MVSARETRSSEPASAVARRDAPEATRGRASAWVERWADAVARFFTVPASTMEPGARDDAARLLDVARQKRDAAALLLARGSRAEALTLARDARATIERAPADARALAPFRGLDAIEPRDLDRDVTVGDVDRLRATLGALYAADRLLAPSVRTAREAARTRAARWIGAALAAGGLALVAWWSRGVHVHASSVYSSTGAAYHVYDGDPETEWWTPDNESGWIDLTFPTRKVYVIKILNSHNRSFMDRGAKDYEVSMWRGAERVWAANGTFPRITADHEWKRFDTGGVRCDKIRIDIKSHHGGSAGLAEVELE